MTFLTSQHSTLQQHGNEQHVGGSTQFQLNVCVLHEQIMQRLQQQCLALVGIQQQRLLPVLILGSLDPQ